jgi:hypothetical protein
VDQAAGEAPPAFELRDILLLNIWSMARNEWLA